MFLARVNMFVSENDQSATGHPPENESSVLMAMLERDFTDLEIQISYKLSGTYRTLLLAAE
jgi:hypothetical protein